MSDNPRAFSARPTYTCPTCQKKFRAQGWQAEYDYQDHIAAHAWWVAVRAEAIAVATWPLLLAWAIWVSMTGPRKHEDWTLPLALLVVACALLAIMLAPGGH